MASSLNIRTNHAIRNFQLASALTLVATTLIVGCEGRTLVDDNPVFAAAPPRRSLVNESTVAADQDRHSMAQTGNIRLTASSSVVGELDGNTVVAEVNGTPIFVDDLIGSIRLALEAQTEMPEVQRQQVMAAEVRRRLPAHIEQEIVLQALNSKIPEDRRDTIRESMEPGFQEVINGIKQERRIQTDDQLNDMLAAEGLSIPLLRESFFRIQMVQGYVQTLAETPATVDRQELVRYYREHTEEFTPEEKVRWQEIVVQFGKDGDGKQAEQEMAQVVRQLQAGTDFASLARKHSDSLTAEKGGDVGWIQRGALTDKEVENLLFQQPVGGMTKVFVRDDRLEVYRVSEHQYARTMPFEEVQHEIEQLLKNRRAEEARKQVVDDLRAKSTVQSIFDDVI